MSYLLGRIIYQRIYFFRSHFIHPPVIAGIILLASGPSGFGFLSPEFRNAVGEWPGYLAVLLFSGLILGEKKSRVHDGEKNLPDVLLQGSYVWFLALGQIAVGLIIYLIISPTGISPLFAHIIEIGWVGGYGAASTMVAVSQKFGAREVGDLSIFSATVGLMWGGLSGMYIAGRFSSRYVRSSKAPDDDKKNAGKRRTSAGRKATNIKKGNTGEDVNPEALVLASVAMFLVIITAYLVREGVSSLFFALDMRSGLFHNWGKFILELPLFFMALLCALAVRKFASFRKDVAGVNPLSFIQSEEVVNESARIMLFVLELLIITAIAGMDLRTAGHNLGVFAIFMLGAAASTLVMFFIFAKRMLPDDYWFELGIINYGMATGITALGLMLLRSIPGGMNSRAMRVYAMAAPLSAPFIGGGIVTFLLPEISMRGYAGQELLGIICCMVLLYSFSVYIKRRIRAYSFPNT